MLRWRLLVAALILVPLLGLLAVDFAFNFGLPGIWLFWLPLLLSSLAAGEVLDLLRSKYPELDGRAVYLGTVLVVGASLVPMLWGLSGSSYPLDCPLGQLGWPLMAMAVAVGLVFVAEMRRFQQPANSILHASLAVFTIVYASLMWPFFVTLRLYHDNRWGMVAVVSLMLIAKMSDTGAYAFGRLLGRHKMAPVLSPKKTVEGGLGGILTAALCSWAYFWLIAPRMIGGPIHYPSVLACIVYGVLIGVTGIVGDLAESLIKRDMERKDSSSWMPGLGGVLDILDSLLFAAPAAYLCWAAGIVGPSGT